MDEEASPLLSSSGITPESMQQRDEVREIIDEGFEYVTEQTGITILESVVTDEPREEDTEEMRWLREVRLKHRHLSRFQKPSLAILCFLLALVCLSETLCITPMIELTMNKVCEGILHADIQRDSLLDVQCDPKKVQSIVSEINSNSLILAGIIGTFMAGRWGELSDRIGRVPVFAYMACIRVIGNSLHMYTLAPSTPYHKWGIIAAASVSYLGGGMLALLANGNSYISDTVNPEHRAISMSIMMSAVYATMGFGPMLGAIIVKQFSGQDFLPIYLSITIGLLAALLCFTVVQEPRHEDALKLSQLTFTERRQSISSTMSNATNTSTFPGRITNYSKYQILHFLDLFSSVKKLWLKPTAQGSLIPRYTVLLLLALDVLFLSVTAACAPALVLFATYKYNWRAVELGYFISVAGLGRAAVLLIISPLLLHLLKKVYKPLHESIDQIDIICIRISVVFLTLSILTVLLGKEHEGSLYACATLQALTAFCSPTVQSAIIKYCSKRFTGQYFGGMALIRSGVMLIVPPTLLKIYGATVAFKPELFLYIPLACGFCAIVLSFFLQIVEDPEILRRESQTNLTKSTRTFRPRKSSQQSLR